MEILIFAGSAVTAFLAVAAVVDWALRRPRKMVIARPDFGPCGFIGHF